MLATLWSSLKQVNNYYYGRKVNNYKSLHNPALNNSALLNEHVESDVARFTNYVQTC